MKFRGVSTTVLLLATVSCSSTEPIPSIVGSWSMIAFRSDGVDATITGTMVFAANGTVTANGTITFPLEAPETLADTGTWSQAGRTLTLNLGGDTGTWELAFTGSDVVLQLQGDASASRLTLRRT